MAVIALSEITAIRSGIGDSGHDVMALVLALPTVLACVWSGWSGFKMSWKGGK